MVSEAAHRITVFVLTYCLYTIFHVSRKVYSDSKDSLSKEWTPVECNSSWPCPSPERLWTNRTFFQDIDSAELYLGFLDSVFLFSYAVGMYFTSAIADRVEPRLMLSMGMCISGVLLLLFGVLPDHINYYNKILYAVLWSLQGIVQSVGWPCCIATIGNWFGKSKRGIIFGLWGSCASTGNIIGNAIAGGLIIYGYTYAFLTVALLMIGGGIVAFFGFLNSPLDIGLPEPVENCENANANTPIVRLSDGGENSSNEPPSSSAPDEDFDKDIEDVDTALSFTAALCLPGVVPYALCYACLKFVNYAFLFWLPYYLVHHFYWSDSFASDVSTWYDIGGIIGAIFCGLITDILGTRSLVMFTMLLLSPFALWGYKASPPIVVVNCVLMTIAGFFVNGVANLLSSAIAIDLAKQKSVEGNKRALATVTGIIDATGSLGAAVGQYAVAAIHTSKGWGWVFNLFILANVAANIFLIPALYRDFRKYFTCSCFIQKSFGASTYTRINNENE